MRALKFSLCLALLLGAHLAEGRAGGRRRSAGVTSVEPADPGHAHQGGRGLLFDWAAVADGSQWAEGPAEWDASQWVVSGTAVAALAAVAVLGFRRSRGNKLLDRYAAATNANKAAGAADITRKGAKRIIFDDRKVSGMTAPRARFWVAGMQAQEKIWRQQNNIPAPSVDPNGGKVPTDGKARPPSINLGNFGAGFENQKEKFMKNIFRNRDSVSSSSSSFSDINAAFEKVYKNYNKDFFRNAAPGFDAGNGGGGYYDSDRDSSRDNSYNAPPNAKTGMYNGVKLDPLAASAYNDLNVRRDASPDEIKKAYRKAAMEFHPDKVADHYKGASEADMKRLIEEANKKFQLIAPAKDILLDPKEKMKYDMALSQAEEQRKDQLFADKCGGDNRRRAMRRALLAPTPNGVCAVNKKLSGMTETQKKAFFAANTVPTTSPRPSVSPRPGTSPTPTTSPKPTTKSPSPRPGISPKRSPSPTQGASPSPKKSPSPSPKKSPSPKPTASPKPKPRPGL